MFSDFCKLSIQEKAPSFKRFTANGTICPQIGKVYFYSAVAPEIGEDAFEGVIFDTDPPNELTIHCPEGISTTLREELTQSESFTESDFTNGKIVIKGDLTPLTYLLGF